MKSITLDFGALAPPLAAQLEKQGLAVSNADSLAALQVDAQSITRLHIRGLLADSTAHSARKKLIKKIQQLQPQPLPPNTMLSRPPAAHEEPAGPSGSA